MLTSTLTADKRYSADTCSWPIPGANIIRQQRLHIYKEMRDIEVFVAIPRHGERDLAAGLSTKTSLCNFSHIFFTLTNFTFFGIVILLVFHTIL